MLKRIKLIVFRIPYYLFFLFINRFDQVYLENKEAGPKNLSEKRKRVRNGGNFELPNIVTLNQAVASFVDKEKTIVNIGSGTGTFEKELQDSNIKIISSEFDKECLNWCKRNRNFNNVTYTSMSMKEIKKKYNDFDLAVSIEVIEHVGNYVSFLEDFSKLSSKAIITTPNKFRDIYSTVSNPPNYYQHVREWTAGEFYWVLKCFYKSVELYALPDIYSPDYIRIGLLTNMTPIIAVCNN